MLTDDSLFFLFQMQRSVLAQLMSLVLKDAVQLLHQMVSAEVLTSWDTKTSVKMHRTASGERGSGERSLVMSYLNDHIHLLGRNLPGASISSVHFTSWLKNERVVS